MTCRVAVRMPVQLCAASGAGAPDQEEILVELALEGDEATFKELAACLNPALSARDLDEMWRGTLARVERFMRMSR
jgi:hypothetical protein